MGTARYGTVRHVAAKLRIVIRPNVARPTSDDEFLTVADVAATLMLNQRTI